MSWIDFALGFVAGAVAVVVAELALLVWNLHKAGL